MRNLKEKTPLGSINNNLLMIKILKKAEIFQSVKYICDADQAKEAHLLDKYLIKDSILKFANKQRTKQPLIMHTFKEALRYMKQRLLDPYRTSYD